MKPEIKVDYRAFQKAAAALKEKSSRSMVDFINGQALKVAIESVRRTQKADASKIEHELGAIGRNVSFKTLTRGKNKGKTRTVRGSFLLSGNSLARRILGWRMANLGSFGVKGSTDDERVSNLIRYRTRSKAFIASGWIHARNALFSAVKQKPGKLKSVEGARAVGQKKGSATPAHNHLAKVIQATIVNTALLMQSRKPSIQSSPMRVAVKGLQAALNETAKDMINELQRRLQKEIKT